MLKPVLLICFGLVVGYFAGFGDAQDHSENLGARIIHRVGGDNRDRVSTDVDKQMEQVGKP
ncbi:MAG: hypothetical protein H0U66_18310 [Gemmatimonadaceae bacterium]|nr:hypothetical protein [Gemmatimonadaceae bacterium]